MARKAKTKIGGGPGTQRATAARARSADQARAATSAADQRAARTGATIERGAAGTASAFQRQAAMGQEQAFRGEQAIAQREQQQGQFEQQLAQRQGEQAAGQQQAAERTDLAAAQGGLERDPEFARREAELRAEMERGERQGIAPGELEGSRFVPTDQAAAEKRSGTYQKAYGLETQRMRAINERTNTRARAAKALATGDKEAYKHEKERYASGIQRTADRHDRIVKAAMGDGTISKDDISFMKQLAGDNPNPELQQEIESGKLGPHSARLLKGKMIHDGLEFVGETGDWPSPENIDEAHPIYQQFQGYVVDAGDELKRRQQFGAFQGIKSLGEANRMKRKAAAVAMIELERRRQQRTALGGGGNQPEPSVLQPPGAQQNVGPQPGAQAPGPQSPTTDQQVDIGGGYVGTQSLPTSGGY